MPWINFLGFSESLIAIPGFLSHYGIFQDPKFKHLLVIYIGYVFLILAAASLFFNYKGHIQKAKWAYYAMIGYCGLVIILNIEESVDVEMTSKFPLFLRVIFENIMDRISPFDILYVGFYVFIASFIVSFKFLKEEIDPEVID